MEKVANNFNFSTIENIMMIIGEDHSLNKLCTLKNELNKFFYKSKCREIIYTNNTDKLFFGMRVYPVICNNDVVDIITDENNKVFDGYYLELDSKLFDPLLNLNEQELTAILLHEVGHIAYDLGTIDEVRKQIDMYFVEINDTFDTNISNNYKSLLAYALKDSVIKVGSLFSKIGNDELIADSFVFAYGYGEHLQSAINKISKSLTFVGKNIDNRLITLAWVLRLKYDFKFKRLPAIKTLNKAKQLTSSKLEEREIAYVINTLNSMNGAYDINISESIIDNVKNRFNKKFNEFKTKGIRYIKNDIYELNLRIRCAETENDLLYVIRTLNSDIAILKDYLTEEGVSEEEREEIYKTLEEMYKLRNMAAKNKEIRSSSDSLIQIVYPEI